MSREWSQRRASAGSTASGLGLALLLFSLGAGPASAQSRGNPEGEWRYWGGDAWSTRFAPLEQVNADNFEELEVAWVWRGDNFGPRPDNILRATPLFVNGRLYTVAGSRRTAAAIDAATGETLWTFREPHTERWVDSPRQSHGRGVAYAEVDGRGVIYLVTPGFFLHALDAETGEPLEGFGKPVPVEGFGKHGTVDMLADLGHPFDPFLGTPDSIGKITTSSPPIVVDGVVIVGNSALPGMNLQTRIENVPGDILAYDARTGRLLWKFNVIPRPGEVGHETWENDAWRFVGNSNAWAPLSADLERGIVYIPTDAPTNDVYGGFRPGNNLFANSLIALDAKTGKRVWHFQTVHHDAWDYDNPTAPILFDINANGRRIPAVTQITKHGLIFTFNRETGEPVWPIEERPVPQSKVPGERLSPTQPFPTKPAPYEPLGMSRDDLVDFTPEIRQKALELTKDLQFGPLFNPLVHEGNAEGLKGSVICPSFTGGANIMGAHSVDPEAGVLFVTSVSACSAAMLSPGAKRDQGEAEGWGRTVVDWMIGPSAPFALEGGLPVVKPPYGRITAIDMNTGEHLWWIPNGDTPDFIKNHPLLQGVEIPNTGQPSHAHALATRSLLLYGEGRTGAPRLHAVDKRTGKRLGTVALPAPSSGHPMSFVHEGKQYIVVPVAGNGIPGSLVALRLP